MEQRNNDSDVGSDFSSDGEQSGFKNKYILSDNSNDSMDENPTERRTRPRIVDGRKKSPSRAKGGNRSENNRRQKNAKNDRGSNRKNEKRDKKSEKAASVERESRQSKTEVCKYYLAQSCLKGNLLAQKGLIENIQSKLSKITFSSNVGVVIGLLRVTKSRTSTHPR